MYTPLCSTSGYKVKIVALFYNLEYYRNVLDVQTYYQITKTAYLFLSGNE